MKLNYIDSGIYGNKKIFYRLFGENLSHRLRFFFLHGVFSTTLKEKYQLIARQIVKNKLGSVFLYETSRKINSWESKMEFYNYEKTFRGKTFLDEKNDVEIIFDHFLKITSSTKKINIILVGFSLGGTLASFLLPKYGSIIKSVFLFGSGITTKRKNLPILSTYPPKEKILQNFKNFKGSIYLIQGDKDNVVPTEEAKQILKIANQSLIKKNIILKNVDHQFNLISEKKKKFIKNWIYHFIKNSISEEEKFRVKFEF